MSEVPPITPTDAADAVANCAFSGGVPPASMSGSGVILVRADELQAYLPLFPVLSTQLREAAQQVEDGVVGVCRSFEGMAQRARDAVRQIGADEDEQRTGGCDLSHLIVSTRHTMSGLLQRIEQTSTLSVTTVHRMDQIERGIRSLEKSLHEIDNVAANARLLALNGQIEAARAGKHGTTFAIVATETAKMALHAIRAARSIREMMAGVSQEIAAASSELNERASTDSQMAAQSRLEVDEALDDMAAVHQRTLQAVAQAHENSQQLARDISRAVVAMQFQDAVSQRVSHVITTLNDMHDAMAAKLDPSREPPTTGQGQSPGPVDWTSQMAGHYTMASEHQALTSHTEGECEVHDLGDNVELF